MSLSETQKENISKEFTIKAIENNLIARFADSKDTAKAIVNFYHEIMSTINNYCDNNK